jgi:DNA-binding GntR family transcriptional regulator
MTIRKPTAKRPGKTVKESQKKHDLISEDLRKRIAKGSLTGRIPGQRVLAQEYDVNFLTVRRAVATLVKEGLLVRQPSRGTFVTRLKRERTRTIAAVFGGLSLAAPGARGDRGNPQAREGRWRPALAGARPAQVPGDRIAAQSQPAVRGHGSG